MRAYFVLTLLVAIFTVLGAAQLTKKDEEPDTLPVTTLFITEDLPAEEEHLREKRATCDLLQPLNLGNAPCAANCIRKGYKGGWCDNKGVCNCRR